MDMVELRGRVGAILQLEEIQPINWSAVETLSLALDRDLADAPNFESPEVVNHFLDDFDIRQKDLAYAERQRADVRRFVETGDFSVGKSMSKSTCLVVMILIVALLAWVFLS